MSSQFVIIAALVGIIIGLLGAVVFYLVVLKKKPSSPSPLFSKLLNKKILIPATAVILLSLGAFFFLSRKSPAPSSLPSPQEKKFLTSLDQYPIWVMRGGAVSVYRQLDVYSDSVEKHLVVTNLSDQTQEDLQIIEVIPKEIAESASELEFNLRPEIVENDPIVRWDLSSLEAGEDDSLDLTYTLKTSPSSSQAPPPAQDLQSLKTQKNPTDFLDKFETHWPTFTEKDPLATWEKLYHFSQTEMEKSKKAALAGKTITVAKDFVDIGASLATGVGALDALGIAGELYGIGTTLYGEDTPESFNNAAQWLTILSLVENGVENRKLLKAGLDTGIAAIKAAKGTRAAAATAKLSQAADALADSSEAVSAAQSAGLNIAGAIVDYAVINDVAQTTKYQVFEMNEQTKMAFLSKNLLNLWNIYQNGDFTDADAKKLMELEIFFFLVQQDELRVRKEYLKTQLSTLDTLFSYVPVAGQYSARQGLADIEETMRLGENQLNWRLNAREKIYAAAQSSDIQDQLDVIEMADLESLENAAVLQNAREEISAVVKPSSENYAPIKNYALEVLARSPSSLSQAKTSPSPKPTPKPQPKADDTSPPSPPTSTTKTFSFSQSNFPDTLIGFPRTQTGTTHAQDNCYEATDPKDYLFAVYEKGDQLLNPSITRYAYASAAQIAVSDYARCLSSLTGFDFISHEESPILNYPTWSITTDSEVGEILAGTFSAVDEYLLTVVMVIPQGTGGQESDHRQAMEELINAFFKEGAPASQKPSAPASTSGCQKIDLSQDYQTYYYYKDNQSCSSYTRNISSSKVDIMCNDPVARWREHYVKEIPAHGASTLTFKGDLSLIDHSHFFVESGGIGVKYDDYVNMSILSSNPNSLLQNECNRGVSQDDWPKCAIRLEDPNVLHYCGVPKWTENQTCDFTVNVSGLDQVYLVLYIADAWPNQVNGIFQNIQVCSP